MCLGVPMRVEAVDGFQARCSAKGVERDVSLFLLQHDPVQPGEFVVVHVGYAIQRLTAAEAAAVWKELDALAALGESADADGGER